MPKPDAKKSTPPKPAPSRDAAVDEAGEETFPASDPPSWTPTHAGEPADGERKKSKD